MHTLLQDLRYAFRMLRKTPGFTAVVIVTLALGIGANTAIFTLVNAVMLKRLPVKNPAQIVMLSWAGDKVESQNSGYGRTSLSYPLFERLRARSRNLSSLFGFAPLGFDQNNVNVTMNGQSSLAAGEMVTGDYFSGLGVAPLLGRMITESDVTDPNARAAVINYAYWSKLGRDRTLIGKQIALNGIPFTIVGVAAPGFGGVHTGHPADIWIPITDHPALKPWTSRSRHKESLTAAEAWWWLTVLGRLKPGVTPAQAQAELTVLAQQSVPREVNPGTTEQDRLQIKVRAADKGLDFLQDQLKQPFYILLTLVSLVLLIACANVATLLLARASARQREIGIRLALGATRGRLIRQLLTESVLLAGIGGTLGLLFAQYGTSALLLFARGGEELQLNLALDANVLGFTLGLSALTGILFGLAPAFPASRIEVAPVLKSSDAHAVGPARRFSFGKLLVGAQVALSLLLLISAGLFLRTLQKLQNQNFGFDQHNVLLFKIDPARNGYEGQRLLDLHTQVLQRLQALPGVTAASLSYLPLLSGWVNNAIITVEGYTPPDRRSLMIDANAVGPDFFRTMRIPHLLGRSIEWRDSASAPAVVVVNTAFARRYFGEASPLGHRLRFQDDEHPSADYEIVGVVADAKYARVRRDPNPTAYIPYTQSPWPLAQASFELRASGDPAALTAAVRQVVRDIDPNLPLLNLKTQVEQIDQMLTQERLFAQLSGFFGVLGLLLACIGLHGTMAYAVTRRTSEIGVRMALGAPRSLVLWMVLRQSLVVVFAGIVIGIPAALAASRLAGSMISGLLFGLKATDPATIAGASILLLAVAAFAGYLPARRASRVDPMVALRYE